MIDSTIMQLIFGIIVGLIILVFLVVVHELGHAIAARRNGVVVREFGIGFPPRAWAKKLKSGILFSLNWLPLGGFVRLKGEYDSSNKPGDYGAATYWQKTRILLAGVLINWLVAALLLTILALTGMPKVLPNQFSVQGDTRISASDIQIMSVIDKLPAETAGLRAGDKIVRFNGTSVTSSLDLIQAIADQKGKPVTLDIVRDGKTMNIQTTLRSDSSDHKGYIGATFGQQERIHATWSAPIVGVVTTGQFTWETIKGLGSLLVNVVRGTVLQFSGDTATRETAKQDLDAAGQSVGGPVAIIGVLFPQAQQAGLTQLTFLAAIISLTLTVMNILPIPALDGGRWYVMTYYRMRNKPLTKEREERFQQIGFLIIMALVVVVTVHDVIARF